MQTSQLDAVRPAETQVAEAEESVQVFPIGSPRTEAIAASVREEASRPIATMGEAAGAAIQHWTTTNLLNAVRKPAFVPDDTFDVVGRLNLLPFAPTPDEERILRKTVSDEDFDYEVGRIQNLREAARVMGDRPVVAFAALAADPLHIVTDIASLRMASLLRARRLAAATAAGTGTAALGAAEYATSPISSSEVILGAMLNSAAVGALHRTGRAVSKAEADLVSKEVGSLVAKSTDEIEVPVQRKVAGKGVIEESPAPKGNKDTLKGAEQVPKVLEETSTMTPPKVNRKPVPEAVPIRQMVRDIVEAKPGTHSAPVVAAMRKLQEKLGDALDHIQVVRKAPVKRSYYDPATDTIYLRRGVTPNMVAHEVAHAATAHKIRYGRLNPNTTHGKIVRELEDIRKTALKELGDDPNLTGDMAYYLGKTSKPEHALDEFVAGLFSGDKKFLEALSKIVDRNSPVTGVPILRSLWDAVRRLLGLDRSEANLLERAMGLTDDLLDAPVPASRVDPMAEFLFAPAAPTAPTSPQAINAAVTRQLDSLDKRIGAKVAWNLHKSASKFNQRVADILFSDPTNQSKASASSVKRAIQADLKAVQFEAEGKFAEELARRGIRQWHYLWHKGEALKAQNELTREVAEIMAARENAERLGATYRRNPDNPLEDIADAVQRFYDAALEAESRAGVFGAEGRTNMQGYFQRRWDAYTLADVDAKFGVLGDEAGKEALAEQVARTIRTEGLSESEKIIMAKAILDRTRSRGEFADNLFRGHIGNEAVLEIEDMLRRYGLDEDGIQRVSGVLTGRVEEAGKASRFKSRMDIDMTANIVAPDGTVYRMTDLMETDLMRLMEVRADEASGAAALARMGVVTVSDVSNLRADFLKGAKTRAEKEEAAYLFDNGMKVLMGQPVGESMNRGMRLMAAATQMVGLAYSGLWQVTEYAKMMSRYGLLRVVRESVRELPGLTTVARDDPSTLNRVLARNSYQEIRLRPFLSRLEDNFDISRDDRFLQVAHHAKQWVPFINAMAYVHRHQARVAGNLILDTIEKAAKGDAKAKRALSKYGVDKGLLDEVSEALRKHGESVDAWPVDTWERLRDPLTRMIDDDVLRSKTGEIPAFAQFSQVGKFIFTFRSFVLGAHNKILAGTLTNEGAGAMALMLAYQLPLTMAATQAASILRGDGFITDEKEWAEKTFSQMGGLGLFADLSGVILGNKDQFGAPGMIAVDKGFRLANEIASGDIGGAVKAGISATPLLGITPGMNALHLIWE